MFRKLMLSAVLSVGAVTGLALNPLAADAAPPMYRHDHDERYEHRDRFEVTYRRGGCWETYGTFRDYHDAERAAHRLRHDGFEVRVERERS